MLLDTNAISAWAKGDAALWSALRPDRPWYLPSIALGEYRYGLLKSTRRNELERWRIAHFTWLTGAQRAVARKPRHDRIGIVMVHALHPEPLSLEALAE